MDKPKENGNMTAEHEHAQPSKAPSPAAPTTDPNVCPKCRKNPLEGVPTSLGCLGAMLMGVGSVIIDSIYLTARGYRCKQCGRISMEDVPAALRSRYHMNIAFSIFIVIVILVAVAYIASL